MLFEEFLYLYFFLNELTELWDKFFDRDLGRLIMLLWNLLSISILLPKFCSMFWDRAGCGDLYKFLCYSEYIDTDSDAGLLIFENSF